MGLRVKDLMETQVVSVRPDLTVSELEEVLIRHRVHGAPVIEGGKIVGVISRSDVVRQLKLEEERIGASAFYLEPYEAHEDGPGDPAEVMEAAGQRLVRLHVRDMMVRDVVTIAPEASLQELARRMVERSIHRVLVTEGEALRGIVSSRDLVELFASGRARVD
jgi:CBS domain-containing protein